MAAGAGRDRVDAVSARWAIVAFSLAGCVARGIVEPAPRKEIVAKRERVAVAFSMSVDRSYVVDHFWLLAADGTACPVGRGMYNATYVGQVIACPYAWRSGAVLRSEGE